MRKNIYLPKQFESIVAEHGMNMSELSQRAILEADPHAKWIVIMRTKVMGIRQNPKGLRTTLASDVVLADCRQMEALNDYLKENKYAESYSWYPADSVEEAQKIWQREAQNLPVEYGIIGDIRDFDFCPVAFMNVLH
jgi:hypothetical protein